jgi:hypothetical protein
MTPYLSLFLAALSVVTTCAGEPTHRDIEYARVGDVALKLDLHLPRQTDAPLIVYVHGGAWRSGSKSDVPISKLIDQGFAIASVDYRLSTQAPFPAQVHDIKAAIRFLRASGVRFHLNTKRIAIVGSSAGGHLAALVGVTNGDKELEGSVGEHLEQSSSVQSRGRQTWWSGVLRYRPHYDHGLFLEASSSAITHPKAYRHPLRWKLERPVVIAGLKLF